MAGQMGTIRDGGSLGPGLDLIAEDYVGWESDPQATI
jgi:hypothetical protein